MTIREQRRPHQPGERKLGVLIVGLGGAVASTVVAGVELMLRGKAPRIGMVTERQSDLPNHPLADMLDFAACEDLVFGGWDIHSTNLYAAALEHKALPREQIESVRDALERIVPWPAIFKSDYASNLKGDHVVRAPTFREQMKLIAADIEEFKRAHGLDECVMVNLASTENWAPSNGVHASLSALEAGLDADDPAITPSMRYFYVANQMRVPFCSFAPGPLSPALASHAMELGNPFAGSDGKTGQTLVKTALGSMFRARQLKVLGWYSINFLGNNDGLVLEAPGSNKTKVLSKASCLDSVVGYPVENHQVHIHYYKPRGDAKEAWDNIDFIGFGGVPMQMKINFLCQDSVLAAPLVIDMVRLIDVAKRSGGRGNQKQLSLFFKAPYALPDEVPVHDLFEQEDLLLAWASKLKDKKG